MDRNKIIGNRIAEVREAHNESQENLAAALGVKRQMVGYWETGERSIKAEVLYQIAERYHVSADYLLGLSNALTTEPGMKAICDYTGLTMDAVDTLHRESFDSFPPDDDASDDMIATLQYIRDHDLERQRLFSSFVVRYYYHFSSSLFRIAELSGKLSAACSVPHTVRQFQSAGNLSDQLELALFRFSKICAEIPNEICGAADADKRFWDFSEAYINSLEDSKDGND